MNILSLCDGLSCGRMALEKVGIKVDKYFASEIKEIAIKATQKNFPDTIQIGDVNKVHYRNGRLFWTERERERERAGSCYRLGNLWLTLSKCIKSNERTL